MGATARHFGGRFPRGAGRWRGVLAIFAGVLIALASLLPQAAWAQDARPKAKALQLRTMAATGPRTSPFDPPAKDIFLTDAAPGLDTGCTFNDSPLNPLTIDVMIDRFVGDVDARGYLVNPAALISAGIIPASVEVLLPAYDIDVNGSPPPERDELLLNGESLGTLSGGNDIWKLNSFRVDIRKIKFPARPAPGAKPVPVANRIQIRIDTLSAGRWCMQADWVALLVPIRPKLGLEIDVVAGNPVHANDTGAAITRIYEQRFDAACNVTEAIGPPLARYPFSGPMLTGAGGTGSAQLRAKIKACPEGSLGEPEVTADWSIAGTSRRGSKTWTGDNGVVELLMPGTVGAYDAQLQFTLDSGQTVSATRRLYVTRKAPLVPTPRAHWYEKGTAWAAGQSAEDAIFGRVLSGLYGYGNASWKYYDTNACSWADLMAEPLRCATANCFIFSDVLQNIAGVLGVGGATAVTELGTRSKGFLTTGSPSLDPRFPGNAKPLGATAYDRYLFGSHSLRKRGASFYDATFNGRYAAQRAFISANLNGGSGSDANGSFATTDEGRRIYPRPGNVYDGYWGNNDYAALLTLSPYPPLAAAGSVAGMIRTAAAAPSSLSFPGSARFSITDADRDGRAEQLVADVDVDVATEGSYVVSATLESVGGLHISNRPALQSTQLTRADLLGAAAGRHVVRLRFSGEDIRAARIDGPWRIVLQANGSSSLAGSGSVSTPGYRALDFGERKATVGPLTAQPLDADGNGRYETVRISATLDVVTAGHYNVVTSLLANGVDLGADSRLVALSAGPQSFQIELPAVAIARAGIDAPYELTLALQDVNGTSLDGAAYEIVGYIASQFESPVQASPSLVEQGIDSNGNGRFDLLRVTAALRSAVPRNLIIAARLIGANGASVEASAVASLTPAARNVPFDFPGPQILRQAMSSAFTLELSFRDAASLKEIDAVSIPLRGVYLASQFDSGELPRAITLTGVRGDAGQDLNGNGLFDRLSVTLGVDLATSGFYEWSARLVDRNGAELGFATGAGNLAAGSASVNLSFDGRPIGVNGLDGPYFLRSFLMASPSGANVVSPFAGETSALAASRFEGYTARQPADLNGDGVVDAADLAAFNAALGSGLGEPKYNRFADFDRDGRVTLNDLRHFRAVYTRR